ncbi:MAG: hypothetical protein NT033_00990 [Candidatus Omnitrophica bacterium]|nr:hypothetical protein [Candidatus Omnitrophota bacterium]
MDNMLFEFSDTIAGYVTKADKEKRTFSLKTSDNREFEVKLSTNCTAGVF